MSVRPRLLIANRRFQFQKRSQLFIGTHNVTFPVAAMCGAGRRLLHHQLRHYLQNFPIPDRVYIEGVSGESAT